MVEDRDALVGVLAVRRGWVQPGEVGAAQVALAMNPRGTLSAELVASGVLSRERSLELERLADGALSKAGGDVRQAIADNGGLAPAAVSEDEIPTDSHKAVPFGDDEERTSIELDLTPPPPASAPFDEEDEPTQVLDWDRAMKKSLK